MTWRQFLNGILLLTLLVLVSGTTGDPDLWGHVRFGQDMLATGSIHVPDTYSFTSDRPWVNHEWLAEVAMALAFDRMGGAGLNLLRIVVVCAVLSLMWRRLAGVNPRYVLAIVTIGAVGIYLRAHPIRPQLFSLLMFAMLLTLLDRADDRRSLRPLALVPLVMAVWVNCHGGWIVGCGIFGVWCALTAFAEPWPRRAALAGFGAATLVATLLNPYGLGMWQFLWTTVGVDRPLISDWQPMYMLPFTLALPWLITVALVVIVATRTRLGSERKYLALALLLGVMAVRVSRLDAFFAIAAIVFVARALRGVNAVNPDRTVVERRPALTYAFAACAVAALLVIVPRATIVPMAPGMIPDREVGHYLQANRLTGTVLTWFDWGEYTLWHFGPDLKVSMDGRRETVYSAALVDAHMRFYQGGPDAWRYADTLQPDYVWIPNRLPVVTDLRRHGWVAVCEGPSSILLTRRHVAKPCEPGVARASSAFPQL